MNAIAFMISEYRQLEYKSQANFPTKCRNYPYRLTPLEIQMMKKFLKVLFVFAFFFCRHDAFGAAQTVTPLESSVPTGTAVFVNAYPLLNSPADAQNMYFVWDFNDSSQVVDPREYNNGSKLDVGNAFPSPVAGHVFYVAGPHTITLNRYQRMLNSARGQLLQTVRVNVNVVASGRRQYFVDAVHGNDKNAGTQSAPFQTVDKATSKLGNSIELDFMCGQSFSFSNQINLGFSNAHLSHYGSGSAPVLNKITGGNIINTWNSKDVAVNGLTFTSTQNCMIGVLRGINTTFIDCNFGNVNQAIQGSAGANGILIQGCTQLAPYGIGSRCEWIEGSNWVSVGNTYFNSGGESPIRMDTAAAGSNGGVGVSIVADRIGQILTPSHKTAKAALTLRCGSNITQTACLIVDAENSVNTPGWPNKISNVDLRQNILVGISQSDGDAKMCFYTGIFNGAMQDNLVYTLQGPAYIVSTTNPDSRLNCTGILFRNNAMYGWSANSRLVGISGNTAVITNTGNIANITVGKQPNPMPAIMP